LLPLEAASISLCASVTGRFVDARQRRSILKTLKGYFGGGSDTVSPEPSQRLRLSGRGTRIPLGGLPFAVEMGSQTLHLYPDLPVDEGRRRPPFDYLLFDPERYLTGIGHALRLRPGEKLDISHRVPGQRAVFSHPRDAFRRHLQVIHEGDALVFKDYVAELGTYVSLLQDEAGEGRLAVRRAGALDRLLQIYGGPIEPLPSQEAMDTLTRVNALLGEEPYRRRDTLGNLGALVELPAALTPVIVGDLHAQVDNLLRILSDNGYLDGLERGEAALVILGDAVHPEAPEELANMDSSVLIMDLIFRLKLRFPKQIFFIIGNHDSFSPDVMKGGVAQSLLWAKRVTALRGPEYRDALELFYRQCALVVLSEGFVACHAAPPRGKPSIETLVNVRQFPQIVHELTWNRIKSRRYPAGYTRGDVRRFRSALALEEDVAFIVGHYPRSADATVWLDVDEIEGHHIIYSAMPDQLAVFTRLEGVMVPQIYPAEPLREWLNQRAQP